MKSHIKVLIILVVIVIHFQISPAQTNQQKLDGFWDINFSSSVADARKTVAQKNGIIEEGRSDKNMIQLSLAKLDYNFLQRKYTWRKGANNVYLNFVNDKFYLAKLYISEVDADEFGDVFKEITREFNDKYYKTSETQIAEDGNGVSRWRFKQADGQQRIIVLMSAPRAPQLTITFADEKLMKEADIAENKQIEIKQTIVKLRETAAEHYRQKQFGLAVDLYSKIIQLDPGDEDALVNRGLSYVFLDKHELSLGDFSRVIELFPGRAKYYSYRAGSYSALGKHRLAITDLTSVLKIEPDNTLYLNMRGSLYATFSSVEIGPDRPSAKLALADLNKSIQIAPNKPDAYEVRALIFCDMGKKELAAADEEKAISLGGEVTTKCK